MWLHPPPYLLEEVLEKIILEEARGVLIVPHMAHKKWFQALSRVAFHWWDVPLDEAVLMDQSGDVIQSTSKWRIRVVFFDAFGAKSRRDTDIANFCAPQGEHLVETNILDAIISEVDYGCGVQRLDCLLQRLSAEHGVEYGDSTESLENLNSVIESSGQVAGAERWSKELKSLFEDVPERPVYAKAIEP